MSDDKAGTGLTAGLRGLANRLFDDDRIGAVERNQLLDAACAIDHELDGWVPLPKDADGRPWHVGDAMEPRREGWRVASVTLGLAGWTMFAETPGLAARGIDRPGRERHAGAHDPARLVRELAERVGRGLYADEPGVLADRLRDIADEIQREGGKA